MKLTILQNKLKQGLVLVEKIAGRSPTLPILNNVLISAEGNFLKLSTTNLEMGINYWILAKIEKQGKIAIPASIFSNFINYLPPVSLELEEKQSVLNLEAKDIKTKIKGVGPEDFPIIPKIEKEEMATIKSLPFCQGLSQVIGVASLSTIRPEISGIYLLFQKNSLTMTATDSFRLGEKKIILKEPLNLTKEYSLILPQPSAAQLVSLFGEKEVDINVYFSPNLIMFESMMEETDHPQLQFVSKLIEGEYPQYQEIIPKAFKINSLIDKKELIKQIKTAGLFAGRINEVKMKFLPQEQQIQVFCQNAELGEHSSVLPAKIKGQEAEASFNFKFLLDGLLGIKGNEVSFALSEERNGEEGPGLLRPTSDETYLYVVMPIQTS